ncbi:hypothetical protein HMPREF0645_0674 [Hallella bergensis DSM 17361]|uniref:Uncharacterized protein n=1 Tax=Hallella bergensis DSM 17361 TaxID=585502 RepID=D1PUN9_9BACT|nr:hypothetical protein HMPREF0645_0674 [Hallella bergensis DSM 17361]
MGFVHVFYDSFRLVYQNFYVPLQPIRIRITSAFCFGGAIR